MLTVAAGGACARLDGATDELTGANVSVAASGGRSDSACVGADRTSGAAGRAGMAAPGVAAATVDTNNKTVAIATALKVPNMNLHDSATRSGSSCAAPAPASASPTSPSSTPT